MNDLKIAVIGLGYVGLPLAIELAKHHQSVIGYDISDMRVQEIQNGFDRTGEIDAKDLQSTQLKTTVDAQDLRSCNLFIVTVPTPVTSDNQPDLTPLRHATETIAQILKKGDIVVYESTVYPGVTEDFCGALLQEKSNLICGQDFYLGYSPERINPGDKVHTLTSITKVVSGQNAQVLDLLSQLYGTINNDNIFKAASIRVAEAAKVIENAQRDINIAFVNEIALIFTKLGISIYDVLDAAQTKWNFLNFAPGLVGGHCIGVDPFYLATCAMKIGHVPKVILAGREINDQMSQNIALQIENRLQNQPTNLKRLLVLGLTFKENVPDLRNTKVIDLIYYFRLKGYQVDVHDSFADPKDAQKYYHIDLINQPLDQLTHCPYQAVIAAVGHEDYLHISSHTLQKLMIEDGLVADLKGMWRQRNDIKALNYWTL